MVTHFSKFYDNAWVGFVLTLENAFFLEVCFKASRKSIGSSEKRSRDFQNSPPLVESTNIENAPFPYKTAISEANFKTRMVSRKLIYHKERSFASNYFIFSKILLQFKNLL